MSSVRKFVVRPFTDVFFGLELCMTSGVSGLVLCFIGLAAGWWVYVPVHELLHALGCIAGGGRVWLLEISPLYGGALLERWFPFVEAGGDYAGRLAGFDTGGHDWVHVLTTFFPFLLTLFPGVWLLRQGAKRGSGLLYGFSLAIALAPLISLTGDAYEIGSLIVVQLFPWSQDAMREVLVGDDVAVVIAALREGPGLLAWVGGGLSFVIGAVWALSTYGVGGVVASKLGAAPLEAPPRQPRKAADSH